MINDRIVIVDASASRRQILQVPPADANRASICHLAQPESGQFDD
jgi:hypothetical protein